MLKVRRRIEIDREKEQFVSKWLTSGKPDPARELDFEQRFEKILDELHKVDKVVALRKRR